MTTHLEIAAAFFSLEPRVDIGHQHMTVGSDAVREPESYRSAPATYLPAPPTWLYAGRHKMARGEWVIERL